MKSSVSFKDISKVQQEPHDQDVAPPLEKNFEGADFINERT